VSDGHQQHHFSRAYLHHKDTKGTKAHVLFVSFVSLWWAACTTHIVVLGRARLLSGLLSFVVLILLIAQPTNAAPPTPTYRAQAAPVPVATDMFTVTGTVTNQQDAPVKNVEVFAFSAEVQSATYTNSSGQFTLTLITGTYDIVFIPPQAAHLGAVVERGINQSRVLNVSLPAGFTISGTIYRDAGHTMPVTNTAIYAFNTTTFAGFGLPPSQADGSYSIALEAGDWELTFTPPPFIGLGPTLSVVSNLAADITRDIVLPPGFTLFGHVTAPSGAHAGVAGVEIFAKDPGQPAGYGFAPTNAGGWYTGTLPLGTFNVRFLAPPSHGFGSTIITGVAGPADVHRNIVLPSGYTVSGHTYSANTFVLGIPNPPLTDGEGWGRFSGSDRQYALALQPGIYTFRASPPGGAASGGLSMIRVQSDMVLNFGFYVYLPLLKK